MQGGSIVPLATHHSSMMTTMKPFRVALCQLQAHDLVDAESAYQEIASALDDAGAAGAQLVCLPECSYPAY